MRTFSLLAVVTVLALSRPTTVASADGHRVYSKLVATDPRIGTVTLNLSDIGSDITGATPLPNGVYVHRSRISETVNGRVGVEAEWRSTSGQFASVDIPCSPAVTVMTESGDGSAAVAFFWSMHCE